MTTTHIAGFRTLCTGLALLTGMVAVGCAPSIRYSSRSSLDESGARESVKVAPDWDYRRNYRIPQERLLKIAASYIGVKYRWGGMSRAGIDCSGLVVMVFKELAEAKFPRTVGAQHKLGRPVDRARAAIGDLVFFRTGMFNTIGHVGIMLGDKRFIHASSSPRGVIYSSLDEEYYQKHFAGIRRLFQ